MWITRRAFAKFVLASGLTTRLGSLLAAGDSAPAPARSPELPAESPRPGRKSVGVLLYDGALILDFGIAGEMFAAADFQKEYEVWTFSVDGRPVRPHLLGEVRPDHSAGDAPKADVLILPGGMNWPRVADLPAIQDLLKSRHSAGTVLFAVCSGGFILARNGFLDGRRAITNFQALSMLRNIAPRAIIAEGEPYVDLGDIVTTSGSGAAMDATLHLIERLSGRKIAADLARRYLDYPYWRG